MSFYARLIIGALLFIPAALLALIGLASWGTVWGWGYKDSSDAVYIANGFGFFGISGILALVFVIVLGDWRWWQGYLGYALIASTASLLPFGLPGIGRSDPIFAVLAAIGWTMFLFSLWRKRLSVTRSSVG